MLDIAKLFPVWKWANLEGRRDNKFKMKDLSLSEMKRFISFVLTSPSPHQKDEPHLPKQLSFPGRLSHKMDPFFLVYWNASYHWVSIKMFQGTVTWIWDKQQQIFRGLNVILT